MGTTIDMQTDVLRVFILPNCGSGNKVCACAFMFTTIEIYKVESGVLNLINLPKRIFVFLYFYALIVADISKFTCQINIPGTHSFPLRIYTVL